MSLSLNPLGYLTHLTCYDKSDVWLGGRLRARARQNSCKPAGENCHLRHSCSKFNAGAERRQMQLSHTCLLITYQPTGKAFQLLKR